MLPNATTIGEHAFHSCSSLTSVSLPNATTIGVYAFYLCKSLVSASLPNAVTIGESAFDTCSSLTSVSLQNVATIGMFAFSLCSSLTSVYLPNARTIGKDAFGSCGSLTSVYLPNATTIGDGAFSSCDKLEAVIVSFGLLANPDRKVWGLRDEAMLLEPFTNDEVKNATHKVAVFAGEKLMSGENYEKGCAYYGLTPKTEPQVVKEDEIAVTKESIEAAKAEAVSVADGVVSLGVTVNTNGNFTAETKSWAPVELKQENVKVENGKIVISIPVDSQSGFMILQSGDAKVGATSGGGPTRTDAAAIAEIVEAETVVENPDPEVENPDRESDGRESLP